MSSSVNFTVHNYVNDERPISSYSTATLQHGRDIVHAASSNIGWGEPSVFFDTRLFELKHDRLFEFNACPPHLQGSRTHVPKDWGVSDDEPFVLDTLEEFIHPTFQVFPPRPARKSSAPPISPRDIRDTQLRNVARCNASLTFESILEPSTNHPRHDVASISNLIPQPHFISGPSDGFPPLDTQHLKPYRKGPASPIFPHNVASVQLFVNSPYNRAAWLIPLRGSLPWDGATRAIIMDSSQASQRDDVPHLPSGPAPQHDGTSRITWTRRSIVAFWKFLISIQQAKNLGPISLSFHTAPLDTTFTLESVIDSTVESGNRPVQSVQTKESIGFSDVRCARLEATDFIKLYHEVKYSLYIRNILDAYQYIPEHTTPKSHLNNRETARSVTKIRLIKGARLVFFDDLSKAAFMI